MANDKCKSEKNPAALMMNKNDNAATLISEAKAGDIVTIKTAGGDIFCRLKANSDIVRGHKIALTDIKSGADIVKYGYAIGTAACDIRKGDYVHTHNLVSKRGRGDLL